MGATNKYIVVDTGVCVYGTRLFSSALGASLLYAVQTGGYTLALPEVLRMEIIKHTIKAGSDASNKIHEQYRLVEMLMGVRDDYHVPTADDFRNRVEHRLSELGVPLKKVPFTFEHAQSALRRVMEETPPNGHKNQQFKDSAIWEALLQLAEEADVVFVTEDTDFFEQKKPGKGLASNLKTEVDEANHRIEVYFGLPAFLDTVVEELPSLDDAEIANSLHKELYDQLNREAMDKGFALASLIDAGISPYLTQTPGLLAIDFELRYEASGVVPRGETTSVPAVRHVEGNCSWNLGNHTVSDVQLTGQKLVTPNGEEIAGFGHDYVVMGSAALVLGRRSHRYRLKEPLPRKHGRQQAS
jgi:hypothetical protein